MATALRFLSWLFANPEEPVSLDGVFKWWEARRLPFNLVVGAYAIPCLVVFFVAITTSGRLMPGEDAVEPIALMAAPIVVNVLYTLGWVIEVTSRTLEPGLSPHFGPRLLKLGLGFGLVLITLPAALWAGSWLLHVVVF